MCDLKSLKPQQILTTVQICNIAIEQLDPKDQRVTQIQDLLDYYSDYNNPFVRWYGISEIDTKNVNYKELSRLINTLNRKMDGKSYVYLLDLDVLNGKDVDLDELAYSYQSEIMNILYKVVDVKPEFIIYDQDSLKRVIQRSTFSGFDYIVYIKHQKVKVTNANNIRDNINKMSSLKQVELLII